MTKTIGDLTLNQVNKIRDRCSKYSKCKECEEEDKACYKLCGLDLSNKENLKKEIEVEEDEKDNR